MASSTDTPVNYPHDRDQNSPYFVADAPNLSDDMTQLLQDYSHVPADKLEKHLLDARLAAWNSCPWPCIGLWSFTNLAIPDSELYPQVLERAKKGDKVLDLGCALGQDLRGLAAKGVPTSNLVGADFEPKLFEAGYMLFNDRDRGITFFQADVLHPNAELTSYYGKFNIITSNLVQHVFKLDEQALFADQVLQLLSGASSDLFFGRLVGTAGEARLEPFGGRLHCYRHSPASLKAFWEDAAARHGRKATVTTQLGDTDALPAHIRPAVDATVSEPLVYVSYSVTFA